ncbi:hypothetical protein KCV04_g41, partial [Aureobasidium melanogenum]
MRALGSAASARLRNDSRVDDDRLLTRLQLLGFLESLPALHKECGVVRLASALRLAFEIIDLLFLGRDGIASFVGLTLSSSSEQHLTRNELLLAIDIADQLRLLRLNQLLSILGIEVCARHELLLKV